MSGRKEELKKLIAALPRGYISRKMIGGKERLYLQWREGDKIKSRYIRDAERETMLFEIEERKSLENELRQLTGTDNPHGSSRASYQIGASSAAGFAAEKTFDYGERPAYYLKWEDDVFAEISKDFDVRFISPDLNEVVKKYAPSSGRWSREDFEEFLKDRVAGASRRDIEEILFKCGLREYDVIKLALATHAVSAADLLWISKSKSERFADAVSNVFKSVFFDSKDLTGDSVDTPEGENIKRYGVFDGRYGIFKKRLSPISTDAESELAVYRLGKRLGISCCPCMRVDDDTVFSVFEYDFSKEYIVHFRRLLPDQRSGDLLMDIISARADYLPDLAKMAALDLITRQDDRHLSNIAVKMSGGGESFYPLYDNGRSLFYEDTEETISKAWRDIPRFATSFGPLGTYYDHVKKLSSMGISFGKLLDLEIGEGEIRDILTGSGFTGIKLEGASKWIVNCIEMLRDS